MIGRSLRNQIVALGFVLTICPVENVMAQSDMRLLQTSDGQSIMYPFNDGQPAKAYSNGYRVESIKPQFTRANWNPRVNILRWNLTLSVLRPDGCCTVEWEDVTGESRIPLGRNEIKSIEKEVIDKGEEAHVIHVESKGIPISRFSTPWLFSNEGVTLIFRIQLKNDHGEVTVLHQPKNFSDTNKSDLRKNLEANEK